MSYKIRFKILLLWGVIVTFVTLAVFYSSYQYYSTIFGGLGIIVGFICGWFGPFPWIEVKVCKTR